ncbi:hypothetical protein CR513_34648, partial [Mucuna pruriens]
MQENVGQEKMSRIKPNNRAHLAQDEGTNSNFEVMVLMVSDLGLLSYFLGIEFEMTRYGMIIHQSKYAKDLLKRLNMQQSNPSETPTKVGLIDPTHYRRIVGCLRYLCNTRPDLNFSVELVSRFMQDPRQSHLLAAKKILRMCKDGRNYCRIRTDWEPIVALSYYEAEYIVASETACQAENNLKKVKLLVNNKSAIDLTRYTTSHARNKHIETRFYFLREQVNNEKLQIEHCRIEIQFADIFIKALKPK